MTARTLAIQSVVYDNPGADIERAAAAAAHSALLAQQAGVISSWTYLVGDCSPKRSLGSAHLKHIGDEVSAAGGEFRYEFFDENLGHGGGQNRLATLTDTDLILILNPDGQLAPDAVTVLASTVTGEIGVADARQVPFEHPKSYDPATGATSWASGACSMTQRTAFAAVGGFDHATFFLYCDDVDYSWRLRLAGFRVVFAPAAALFHDKRLSVNGEWQARAAETYYSAEAALLLAHKYSRSKIVARLRSQFAKDPNEAAQRALAEFDRRERDGSLPTPLDPDHRVGEFVKGNYSEHRY